MVDSRSEQSPASLGFYIAKVQEIFYIDQLVFEFETCRYMYFFSDVITFWTDFLLDARL
ncbi:hypothetical protein QG37_07032 [Candidozyma auris]|uniref:Uncharacterized protein n=1 Tax=Candidozyma auris TaxID=498019 RepID=A0A0L0NR00_CANAR|nr:hypothetical protein QG37_07032 [[Candida] auris]